MMLKASQPAINSLIAEIRQHLGLSPKELANHLGVAVQTVKRWEKNYTKPSSQGLQKIQRMLLLLGQPGYELLVKYFPEEKTIVSPQTCNWKYFADKHNRQIEALESCIAGLLQNTLADPKLTHNLIIQAFAELERALSELKMVQEELHVANSQIRDRSQELSVVNKLKNQLLQQEQVARLEAEAARNQVTNILESITDGFFAVNNQWCFSYLNQQAEELLQRSRLDLIGKNIWDEFASLVGSTFDQKFHQALLEQVSIEFEAFLPADPILLEVRIYPSVDGLSVFVRDITEKRQRSAQFLRTQRLENLGTLASGIAHDLNNVLSPILMTAELMLMTINDPEIQELLKMQQKNAQRGAALVKQVLSFARGVEGKHTIVPVKSLILELEQIIKQTFPKSIELQRYVPQDLWAVSGDSTQLQQVLMNLCINARDAMTDGGILKIDAENFWVDKQYAKMHLEAQAGAYIVVTISDTGNGIPADILSKIFEPFFTTKELGKGTGIGLSTVIVIVKAHGGFMTVTSEVGRGSEFKVFLPGVPEAQTQHVEHLQPPSGSGELILVVDDEATIREVIKISLQMYNYRVLTAKDGLEALALYVQHKHEISLVLIDIMMPLMNGELTIQALKKINPSVKIIVISGLASNEKIAQVTGISLNAFLPKPCTTQELLQTISNIL